MTTAGKFGQYNDLTLLTRYIDNQKSFEGHKQRLDQIYHNVDKKSFVEETNKRLQLFQTRSRNNASIIKSFNTGKSSLFYYRKMYKN